MNPELPYDVSLAMLQDGSQKQDVSPFLSETIRERQLFEMRLEFVLPETVEPEQGSPSRGILFREVWVRWLLK
jgi:hypothetical protein